MATLSQSECRRLYSWWWDSHNSPKNSKWLQENLTDIDTKVKSMIKLIEEEADSFARRAEIEARNLKQELTRMEAQKDIVFLPYKLCLEKIPMLEGKITLAEENSRMLNEQIERAELEVKALRKKLTELDEEKESLAFLYNECLKKISSMENEILHAQENAEQLKSQTKIFS